MVRASRVVEARRRRLAAARAVKQSRVNQRKRTTRLRKRNVRRMRYNQEIKSVEHTTSSFHKLEYMAGSDTKGPNSSLVLLPGLFEKTTLAPTAKYLVQGTDEDEVVGRWISPAYAYSQKFVLNYQTLTAAASKMPSPNVTCIYGYIKATGEKISADLTTMGSWTTDIRNQVLEQLFSSGFDSHHCAYRELNRNVKVIKKFVIKPKNSQHKVGWSGQTAVGSDQTFAPNTNLTIKYNLPKWKTRLEKTGDDYLVPHQLWIPFTLFFVDSLSTTDEGYIGIETSSKFWFKDT